MSTWLDRHKKKSSLAALLLLLRARKTLSVLLLLAAFTSFLFVVPSSLLIRLPAGTRVAAAVAWLAGALGMDTESWGLAGDKRRFGDLLAAFRAAKEGDGKAGWSTFMRGGGAGREGSGGRAGGAGGAGGGAGTGSDSGTLDFVKGSRKDLERAEADGVAPPTVESVNGILNRDDAPNYGEGDVVALTQGDVSGEREGLVRSAFAGGFAGGGLGGGFGGGFGGGSILSGGAFAGKGFFGGSQGAAGDKLGDRIKRGLEGVGQAQSARAVLMARGSAGRLSGSQARMIAMSRFQAGVNLGSGQRAFAQLAVGHSLSMVAISPNCAPGSSCPGEFASVHIGKNYDGGSSSSGGKSVMTKSGGPASAVALGGSGAAPAAADPKKIEECATQAMRCEAAKAPLYPRLGTMRVYLRMWSQAMPEACNDQCFGCGRCNALRSNIVGLCGGGLATTMSEIQASCASPSCPDMGMGSPPVTNSSEDLCGLYQGPVTCRFCIGLACLACKGSPPPVPSLPLDGQVATGPGPAEPAPGSGTSGPGASGPGTSEPGAPGGGGSGKRCITSIVDGIPKVSCFYGNPPPGPAAGGGGGGSSGGRDCGKLLSSISCMFKDHTSQQDRDVLGKVGNLILDYTPPGNVAKLVVGLVDLAPSSIKKPVADWVKNIPKPSKPKWPWSK